MQGLRAKRIEEPEEEEPTGWRRDGGVNKWRVIKDGGLFAGEYPLEEAQRVCDLLIANDAVQPDNSIHFRSV